jgi:hypothetical protein
MADVEITDLTEETVVDSLDEFEMVDVSDTTDSAAGTSGRTKFEAITRSAQFVLSGRIFGR